jgi:hypothetical protein
LPVHAQQAPLPIEFFVTCCPKRLVDHIPLQLFGLQPVKATDVGISFTEIRISPRSAGIIEVK